MRIDEVRTFMALESYLRGFTNFPGDPVPYDFVGAFRLFLATLENLARNHIDADLDGLEECRPVLTERQAQFLKKLERLI